MSLVVLYEGDCCFGFWRRVLRSSWFIGSKGGVEIDDEVFDFTWEFHWLE